MKAARGYFAIGIEHGKSSANLGTLWRSAVTFGAAYVFTVGRRYKPQSSDTLKSWKHLPVMAYTNLDAFWSSLPRDCLVVGVELDGRAVSLERFPHPERAIYLLGAEDHGLSAAARQRCHALVQIAAPCCLNVSVAGSIVMWHRGVSRREAVGGVELAEFVQGRQ